MARQHTHNPRILVTVVMTCLAIHPGCGPADRDLGCTPELCSGRGACDDSGSRVVCLCDDGYAGDQCQLCAPGFVESGPGRCQPEVACTPEACGAHGSCDDSGQELVCRCEPGYAGASCDACAEGHHAADAGLCLPDERCEPESCGSHGTCREESGLIECVCEPAYTGDACEACAAGHHEDEAGDCVQDESCLANTCNGRGTCDDRQGWPVCTCDTGYSGDHCDGCAPGYQDEDDDGSCLPTCPTAQLDCGAHGECRDDSGTAACICDAGYAGPRCRECAAGYQDHDQDGTCLPGCSLSGLDCGAHGECRDDDGIAACICDAGYAGPQCRECATGYQDHDQDGTCLPGCELSGLDCGEHGTCSEASGAPRCVCDLGYGGEACDGCAPGFHPDGQGGCLPDESWCGNGLADGREECDGGDDGACPGRCSDRCACPAVSPRGRLEVHLIDVGQGDAILVISPDGFVMLVDGGEDWEAWTVLDYLQQLGVSSIDYVLVSHLHADHLGALDGVLQQVPGVVACFDNGGVYDTQQYEEYDAAAGERRVMLAEGDAIDLGPGMQAEVLHAHTGSPNENLNSLVVRLTYGSSTVLLGGDCETSCEVGFDPGPIDVYKVHHHGSSDSSSAYLVDTMEPDVALIPVGSGNPYGHPTSTVLDRLASHGTSVYRSDLDGHVAVHCTPTACAVQ